MPWNPSVYNEFNKERSAPFNDLLQLIDPRDHISVIDLGCGTGELTRRLADALPESTVLGIDNSPEMLAKAAAYVRPGLEFELKGIEAISGQWDLVFSHAAIQWLPDHRRLIPRLLSLVRPGGQLAVQLPSNHHHFSHRAILETASESPFYEALDGWSREWPVLSLEQYAELLYKGGGCDLTVIEKVYPAVLENADKMAEWTSGTALVPYLERLPVDLHSSFMERYRVKLRAQCPEGEVYYPFRRILFAASRGA